MQLAAIGFVLELVIMLALDRHLNAAPVWARAAIDALLLGTSLGIVAYFVALRPLVREAMAWRASRDLVNAERNDLAMAVKERTASLNALNASLQDELSRREAVQEALARTETSYRELVMSVDAIILRWDVDGIVTFLNEYGLRFFGFAEEEVVGLPITDTIVPQAESTGRDLRKMIADISGAPERFARNENENVCKDGRRVWVSWTNRVVYGASGDATEVLSVGIDVTQRREYEEALARAEVLSRSILDSVGEGIYGLNEEGVTTFINPAGARMLGYDVSELVGQRMHGLIHHSHPDGTLYPVEGCPTMGAVQRGVSSDIRGEYFWRKDGSHISVEYSSTPMVVGGHVGGAVVTFRDVTERDRIQRELAYNEAKMRTMLETVADGIVSIDARGSIQTFNHAAEQIFGYRQEEAIGQSVDILMPEKMRLAHAVSMAHYIETGDARVMGTSREFLAQRKSGEEFPIDISLAETVIGEERIFTAVIRDITARKAAEESLRQLSRAVEASPVSVVITNAQGEIEYVNPKFEQVTGYTRAEALGNNPRVLKSGLQPKAYYAEMWRRLHEGEEWHGEFHNKKKDGTVFWERAYISPIRDDSGAITHFVAVKEDVTERRRVAEQLKEAKEDAEAASRAKSTFLASMSHEIRTPLNAIMGFSQLLSESTMDDQQRGYLETIHRSSEHLLLLINDILDMSRIESGRTTLTPSDLDFNALLLEMEKMFSLRAKDKGLGLDVGRVEATHRCLRADEGKLRQILINLIGNAVKFTVHGQISVRPRLVLHEGAPVELVVIVEDTGPGIDDEELAGLFDPFVQTESGRAAQGGTGLGLAISRKLARMMGGDIAVRSLAGEGSAFTLRVEVAQGSLEDIAVARPRRKALRLANADRTYQILVADDVMANRQLIMELLAPLGFSIAEAENGQEAVDRFEADKPDLVLMDMGMPVMDGYEATRRIKATEAGRAIPVIAMTARVMSDSRDAIMETGVDGFIGKPFRDSDLVGLIGSQLGIEFVYAGEGESVDAGVSSASGNAVLNDLSILPDELRDRLKRAVIAGRSQLLAELIVEVAHLDRDVADGLKRLADNFQYRYLLEQLEKRSSV